MFRCATSESSGVGCFIFCCPSSRRSTVSAAHDPGEHMNHISPYAAGMDKNPANYKSLTPTSFLERAARVHPDRIAMIHGDWRAIWRETYTRCRRLASALSRTGNHRILPRAHGPLQGAEESRLRAAAENLDRQDSEIPLARPLARTGEGDLKDFPYPATRRRQRRNAEAAKPRRSQAGRAPSGIHINRLLETKTK